MITAKIDFGDTFAKLDALADNLKGEVAISGAAAAARVFYDEVRLRAPVGTRSMMRKGKLHTAGTLRNAIYRVYAKKKSTDTTKRYEVGWNRGDAWYARLIEFGHWSRAGIANGGRRKHTIKGKLNGVTWVAAKPFLRPALAVSGLAMQAAKDRMVARLKELNV